MKKCISCKKEKPLSDYYKHPQMSDGHLNKCKSCVKDASKKENEKIKLNPKLHEKEKERQREKYHRLNYKEKHKPNPDDKKKIIIDYNERYPEKFKAKNLSQRIKPLTKENHMHHWSYKIEYAKDVIELSQSDHYLLHRHMIYDQERMMYRRIDNGILLDSKDSHLNLLNELK